MPQLEGCVYTVETLNTPDGFPFVAVKDVTGNGRGGQVRFRTGSPGWIYKWMHEGVEYASGTYAVSIPLSRRRREKSLRHREISAFFMCMFPNLS